jgi:hypothetical protein
MKKILHDFFRWIVNFFKTELNKDISTSKEVHNPYQDLPKPEFFFKDALGMKDIDRDNKITENLKKILDEIENMGDRFRKLGETDGPFQMRYEAIKIISKNTAIRTSKYIETIFKGISESVENKINVKNKEVERIIEDEVKSKGYFEELKVAKNWKPKNFILWEAIVFFVFGLALLGGDVVLSLTGTREGFFLNENWEVWTMSIGITACTIYIKIYYDEHILPELERSVTMFKHENLKGIYNDDSKSRLLKIWSFRFIVKTMLLIFTIGCFYFLAMLRFEVMSGTNEALKQLGYSKATFVSLSMLFPIIGGVCTAIAFKKLRLFTILWKARKDLKKIRENLYKNQEELSKNQQDFDNCKTYISWTTNKEFIDQLSNFLFACYLHGYEYTFRKYNMKFNILEKAKDIRRLFSGDLAQLNKSYPNIN